MGADGTVFRSAVSTAFRSAVPVEFRTMKSIGDRVRAEREARGITREELAAYAGMAKTTLADLELGTSKSSTKLHKLAERLAVNPDWLETGRGVKEVGAASQPVGLDVAKLTSLLETVEAAVTQARKIVPARTKARIVAALYADEQASAAGSAEAVRATLASILATLEDA